MKSVGIIAEYNPFHNGHKYQIQKIKKDLNPDVIIAIMSGNFVQRGELAIINKWQRTKSALKCGIDMVIELPTYYALSSAEMFAFGGISILDSLNVENIVFGSENGNIDDFYTVTKKLIELEKNHIEGLQQILKQGHSFAKARNILINELYSLNESQKSILTNPNNILGLEYLKSINGLNSKIKPHTIKRYGASYHDTNILSETPSASAIRKFLLTDSNTSDELFTTLSKSMPKEALNILTNSNTVNTESLYPILKYKLMTSSTNELQTIHDVTEGIENKIINSIPNSNSLKQLIYNCKSKRYAQTRISRILMKILLNIKTEDIGYIKNNNRPKYARILGFNNNGINYLNHIKKNCEIEIITNIKNFKTSNPHIKKMLATDILATNIYSEFDNSIKYGEDYYRSPIIL